MLSRIKTSATLGSLSSSAHYQQHLEKIREALTRRGLPITSEDSNKTKSRLEDNDDEDDEDESVEGDEESMEDSGSEEEEEEEDSAMPAADSLLVKDLEDNADYQLILASNDVMAEIDEEIIATRLFISQVYAQKFPELEGLLPQGLEFVKVVQRIGNEMDLTVVTLNDLLTSQQIMMIKVSSSTTAGKPLSSTQLSDCMKACEVVLQLAKDREMILRFIASCINTIAPNLTALLGAYLAAQLIGLAGGLIPLAKIPGCNIQVMGQQKQQLMGLSNHSTMQHAGILITSDLVTNAPPDLKKKTLKVLASKVVLAARIDAYQVYFNNKEGLKLRAEIEGKVDKLQEPHQARTKKALPIPDEKKRTKRGGKRIRKMRERLRATELQQEQNKIQFTLQGGEYGDSAMGMDHLAAFDTSYRDSDAYKGNGKIRAAQQVQSQFMKKAKKAVSGSSGTTNGLSSSLVFTPVQGLELVNPNAAEERVREANKKWFDAHSGFVSAMPKNR